MPQPDKSLLESLLDDNRHDRAFAVADFLFCSQNYTKTISQALNGLACQLTGNEPLHRDLHAIRSILDDYSSWLESHSGALYAYSVKAKAGEPEIRKDMH